MMKKFITILAAALVAVSLLPAQTKIMSHRGYYAHPGSFENTLTSLKGAQQLGVEGVELDVHLTTDDSLVILHGPKIAGNPYPDIQKLDYATVKSCVLPNGDRIPSLREYFTQAKKTTALMLFVELKSHPTPERETQLAEKVLALCDEMNMYDQVTFISFSEHLCDEILRLHKGALYVHLMPEIQNWIGSDIPDMAYPHNTYPCKIIGATIRNECFIARELPARRENALEVARSAAAFLVRMSHPEGHPLAFFPPTYYLDLEASKRDWNKGKTMTLEAASAGHAFLDLYDLTGEKEWLDRAVGIARTYVRLQREDGSLPIKIDFETAEPVNDVSAMLHPLLRYFQRLRSYGIEEFIPAQLKAEKWMDEVAVETFDMTGQFEDVNVKGLQPYQNLTNCTAAPYASYLLDKKDITDKNLSDAKDLIRLSEDQFVHWAYPDLTEDGFPKKNAPCVHEQYHYEMPVDASACNVANAWLDYYELTGDLLSLAKAKAMVADQMTIQQNANNGQLPTTWEWRRCW